MHTFPRVTLTFDNGPEAQVTPGVVECLARHGIRATFFVMGRKAATAEGAAQIREAGAAGHRIGNHTYSHTTPLGELDRAAALAEFEKTEKALAWLEQPQRYFRPYGRAGRLGRHLLHPAVVERLVAGRYTCVLWNSVPGDWRDPQGWVARAMEDCRRRPWSLVVLHDTPTGAMAHLDEFIRRVRDEGWEIVQDYPAECMPIVEGNVVGPIEEYSGAEFVHRKSGRDPI
ncbi:MAG TPA: polysaccharide deacetylase family protein [Bryobacteraceae bacterium]|nr:polysaccharide deacetylase family protein [Bryobacteraceae bacterium]